jgi:acyl dehydratase
VRIDQLQAGLEAGPSSWLEVAQDRIDSFAEATNDHQSIHIDPELAAAGPYGVTVAHGYLTLSLLPAALYEALPVEDALLINYGVNRVRFPAPVPVGSRIRASFRIDSVAPVEGGVQVAMTATVEREGGERPVCVAELVFRYLVA